MNSGLLLVRVEAGPGIGVGHLMRCLALAQAWRRAGGRAMIASNSLPEPMSRRITEYGVQRLAIPKDDDGSGLAKLAETHNAAWIVIDGYGFDPEIMERAAAVGRPVLAIDDDMRHSRYPVRALLNQNLHARNEAYDGKTTASLLLGPRYALIREDLRAAREWRRQLLGPAQRILVTLGGADPGGHTETVVHALAASLGNSNQSFLEIRVVSGGANPRLCRLERISKALPNFRILNDVHDMGAEFRWCDLAISASGSTVWELALFQTPMLLGWTSTVEIPVAKSLERLGAARVLGPWEEQDAERISAYALEIGLDQAARQALAQASGGLVDGLGADRVVEHMRAICETSG